MVVLLIAAFWLAQNYLVKPVSPPPIPPKQKTIEINLEALENPVLQELQLFEEIPPFEGEIGRDNPFLPPGQKTISEEEISPEEETVPEDLPPSL